MKPIPYGRQNITDADLEAVNEVLKSDYLTQGPKIAEFEEAFAKYTGVKYAVAVSNGTAALHLCTLALGVKEGDKIITTPITFAATANSVRYAGGEVVFADIDPETYLIDINSVRKLLEEAPAGTYQGLMPVDFAGRPVNIEEFRKLADQYGLWIIEDACHAPGGFITDSNNEKHYCGDGVYADLSIFSFHPVKHIAAGEGGMITTNSEELYDKLSMLRTHGIIKNTGLYKNDTGFALNGKTGSAEKDAEFPLWYMEMQELGYNYRITDFQAALGLSQLQRADEGLARRREIAAEYSRYFADKKYVKGQSGSIEGHAYHLYILEVENRAGLYNFLRENKIYAQIHYIPCHLMPYYRERGWKEGDLPNSENYYSACISIPMYPTLTADEQRYVCRKIDEFFDE